jgi:acyl transferase domain-containing protein
MKLQPLSYCVPFPEEKVVIGVNSFGFGGANGHAIIEEYVPNQPSLFSQPSKIDSKKYLQGVGEG